MAGVGAERDIFRGSGGGAGGSAQLSGWGAGCGGRGGAKSSGPRPAGGAGAEAGRELLPESQPQPQPQPEPQPEPPVAGAVCRRPCSSRAEPSSRCGLACQPQGLGTVGGSEPRPLGTTGHHWAPSDTTGHGSLDHPCQAWARP